MSSENSIQTDDSSLDDQDATAPKSLGSIQRVAKRQDHRVSFDALPLDADIGSGIFTASSGSGAYSVHTGIDSTLSNDKSALSLSLRSEGRKEEVSRIRKKRQRSMESQQEFEELTINSKLDIKSMGLIGREQETATLKSCYDRLLHQDDADTNANSESSNELVFIRGFSGTRKSKLAQTLTSNIEAISNGV